RRAGAGLRGAPRRTLRLALSRHDEEPQPPLLHDEGVRQPRQAAPPLPADEVESATAVARIAASAPVRYVVARFRRRTEMAERYIVVGGGLAGLMTVIKLAEAGKHVDVFSIVPVKRSHSVCAQGGINGAVNTKGEGDHPDIHVKDTLKGGDFLAEQPPVKGMCYAAPQIIYLLDRMGVPFNRTNEGLLDFRRFGGTLHHRTAFAGASTGQQLL